MSEPGGDPSSGISSGDALIRPERHPACRRREARPGFRMERENLCFVTPPGVKGQAASGSNREGESTEAGRRGGAARSSVEGPVMGLERRGCVVRPWPLANWKREEPVDEAKPFKDVMSWQRPNIGSRVTREGHARFWERPEVKFFRATRRRSPFRSEGRKVRNRRVLPVVPSPREGPLTEPTAGAQPWPRERVLMPHCRHSSERAFMHQATL
jgi:hypothetical protein